MSWALAAPCGTSSSAGSGILYLLSAVLLVCGTFASMRMARARRGAGASRRGWPLVFGTVGVVAAAVGLVLGVVGSMSGDGCGGSALSSAGSWVMVGGGGAASVATAVRYDALWTLFANVTVLDVALTLAVFADRRGPLSENGPLALVLLVHAVCLVFASFWAARGRDRGAVARAKASEAGRVLCSVWVLIVVGAVTVQMFGERSEVVGAENSQVVAAFLGAALVLVTGTGYTKYVEAMNDTSGTGPHPHGAQRAGAAVVPASGSGRAADRSVAAVGPVLLLLLLCAAVGSRAVKSGGGARGRRSG